MGYKHRAFKAACGKCGKYVAWFWDDDRSLPKSWKCSCHYRNYLKAHPQWPDLPLTLYIGPDMTERFKVYPLPPEVPDGEWAEPFCIRSFVYQASRKLGGCHYWCQIRGTVMGETVFTDLCCEPENAHNEWTDSWDCHLVGGWITGEISCALWQRIAELCQTDTEKRFLHRYLGYVKDRQFPMLIPQTWIGIAERRRPDFVAFIPLSFWNYKWLAIQLDASHTEEQAEDDALRDEYVMQHNYEVLSLKPNERGYLEEVRTLVEKIDVWMSLADTDPWEVAVEAEVTRTEVVDDIPF